MYPYVFHMVGRDSFIHTHARSTNQTLNDDPNDMVHYIWNMTHSCVFYMLDMTRLYAHESESKGHDSCIHTHARFNELATTR